MTTLRFDQFQVLNGDDGLPIILGQGATSTVYHARDNNIGREVALKVVRQSGIGSQEVEILGGIGHHPNLITVYAYGRIPDDVGFYYAMEYIIGETLQTRLKSQNRLEVRTAVNIAAQAAEGLIFAHGKNAFHRDIKPENLMLSKDHKGGLVVKLIDLGSIVRGTPAYACPEQLDAAMDAEAVPDWDIYALGSTLWEAITGVPPYGRSTGTISPAELTALKASSDPQWHQLSGFPISIRHLMERWIARDAGKRFSDGDELLDTLNKLNLEARNPILRSGFRRFQILSEDLRNIVRVRSSYGCTHYVTRHPELGNLSMLVIDSSAGIDHATLSGRMRLLNEWPLKHLRLPLCLESDPRDKHKFVVHSEPWSSAESIRKLLQQKGSLNRNQFDEHGLRLLRMLAHIIADAESVGLDKLDLSPVDMTLEHSNGDLFSSNAEFRISPWNIPALGSQTLADSNPGPENGTSLTLTHAHGAISEPMLVSFFRLAYELAGGMGSQFPAKYAPLGTLSEAANQFLANMVKNENVQGCCLSRYEEFEKCQLEGRKPTELTRTGQMGAGTTGTRPVVEGPAVTGAPGTGAPGTGAPGTGAPGTGAPGTGAPGTGAPGTGAPETGAPDTGAPDTGPKTPIPRWLVTICLMSLLAGAAFLLADPSEFEKVLKFGKYLYSKYLITGTGSTSSVPTTPAPTTPAPTSSNISLECDDAKSLPIHKALNKLQELRTRFGNTAEIQEATDFVGDKIGSKRREFFGRNPFRSLDRFLREEALNLSDLKIAADSLDSPVLARELGELMMKDPVEAKDATVWLENKASDKGDVEAMIALAEILQPWAAPPTSAADSSKALKLWTTAWNQNPRSPEAGIGLARLKLSPWASGTSLEDLPNGGDPKGALQLLNEVISLKDQSENGDALFLIARAYEALGENANALTYYKRAATNRPELVRVLKFGGRWHKKGRYFDPFLRIGFAYLEEELRLPKSDDDALAWLIRGGCSGSTFAGKAAATLALNRPQPRLLDDQNFIDTIFSSMIVLGEPDIEKEYEKHRDKFKIKGDPLEPFTRKRLLTDNLMNQQTGVEKDWLYLSALIWFNYAADGITTEQEILNAEAMGQSAMVKAANAGHTFAHRWCVDNDLESMLKKR